ncbi:MAG: ricin-type beta-trefoil lectin domain protein, partial [Holophagales bacterium]|nr:ricin-type beta-trefoil lectin domain protein [Holophagales bacterium]
FDLPITALRDSGLDDLVYRPSSSCTDFEHFAQRATKADVLNAGKNILLYGADSDTCTQDGWGTWTFKTPTAKRVEHGVYYPMVMNRFDGYPSCSYETEIFWQKTTHNMHFPTRFNYAYNDVWALSPLNTMSSGQIDKMTSCGVNAISHEYFDPESATHGALIWSWANGEPNAGASSTSNCAKLGVSGLEDRQCHAGHYFACRHIDTGEWRVTSSYGPWEDGAQTCYEELGAEYGFSMPANGWQMNKLKDARPSSNTQVWVNYNDIDDHGDWEPFQQLTEAVFDFDGEIDGTVHGTSTIDMGFTGGSVPYTQGRDGSPSAIDFDALTDPVLKGTWEQRFDDDLTISVWFKTAPGAAPTENQRLVEFSATGSWATSTALIMETSGALTTWCDDEVDGARHAVLGTGSSTYLDGRWHRAVFVHGDSEARLYVDGVLEGSTTDTCENIVDARYLSIGSYYNDSVNRKFHGAIDAVDIHGFALSPTDIGEGSKIVGDWAGGTLCLDAAGGHNAVSGRNVQVWSCGTTTSSWIYNPGTGRMHAAWNPSLCLDVVGQNSSATDTNVRVWRCDQVTETWTYDPGDRKIRTAYDPNMCLDVAGWQTTTPGRNVQIHPCSNVNETWNEPAIGNLPSLQPIEIVGDWAGGSMCLDAAGGHNAGHRANIQIWSCAATTSAWVYHSGTRKIHAGWDD